MDSFFTCVLQVTGESQIYCINVLNCFFATLETDYSDSKKCFIFKIASADMSSPFRHQL